MTDDTRRDPPPATYPGEPGSPADIGRRRFLREQLEYRERLPLREQLDRA
jgi:hypothetical protein